MWKHVLVAASFDQAWATTNPVTGLAGAAPPVLADIDQAGAVAVTLASHLTEASGDAGPALAGGMAISLAAGSVAASRDGVSGVLNLTVSDPASFLSQGSLNKIALEAWLTTKLTDAPQASVEVTIPTPPTTTLAPATAAPTEAGNLTATNVTVTAPPPSGDPVAALVSTTFVVTLPPGKTEISTRLGNVAPADILAAVASQLPVGLVTGATVAMTASTTNVAGSLRLDTSDTTAVESVANQGHIRTAIAALAHVFVGDVGAITITSADATPIVAEPVPGESVGASVENSRRLTAGAVNAAFTIAVPGLRAQGWQKDCSLQKIVLAPSADAANQFSTLDVAGTAVDATPASCGAEAPSRTSVEAWSWDATGHTCSLSNLAGLTGATFSSTAITSVVQNSCGSCPSTLEDPALWPGVDASASHTAFGVGAMQPVNLQCWPKNSNFDLMPCGHVVVEEYSVGGAWAGRCNNLDATTVAAVAADTTTGVVGSAGVDTTQALCQASCEADPFCTVWQWSSTTSNASDAQCYRGSGNQCWSAAIGHAAIETLVASQRIQHGEVHVIKDNLVNAVLANLQQQFGEHIGASVPSLNTSDAQKEACRKICHSNIMCSYWQSFFDAGIGNDLGCWTENPGVDAAGAGTNLANMVHYPLTTAANEGFRGAAEGDDLKLTGGQFIQHHCAIPTLPVRPPTTTTTTTTVLVQAAPIVTAAPAAGGFMNPWGYILIALGLLAAIAAIAALVLCGQPKPKAKSTRAVKPIAKKEPPPPPPQPVVPLMAQQILVQPTIPQPLAMTTIQQPMTTVAAQAVAQPMTYAGAPQFMQRPY